MFTAVNTSAFNVESVSLAMRHYSTQMNSFVGDCLNALFVANDSHNQMARGLKLIWGWGPHCKISLSRWVALFLETTTCGKCSN